MNSDELLRSYVSRQANRTLEATSLLQRPESELFALIAAQLGETTPSRRPFATDDLLRSDAALTLGKRVFVRWSQAIHDFVCAPNNEDKDLRNQIVHAILNKDGGGVALLASCIVAAFGASPAIAMIVAALLVKLIVTPATDEICIAWAKALRGPAAS